MSLHEYLVLLRKGIDRVENYGYAESIDITEEIRSGKQAVIRIQIVLIDGSVLRCKEFVDAKYKIEKLRYAYQYQNKKGELIFRYDNAAHLAFAEVAGADFVTCDDRLCKKCRKLGLAIWAGDPVGFCDKEGLR